jgi:FkbM family methyltransferase
MRSLKRLVKTIPGAQRVASRVSRARNNLKDAYDSYIARPASPVMTPFGFVFGGLGSQHHRRMQKGTFEPEEVRLLTSLIRRADVFVDVGANVGFYTCIARYIGKPAIAIEPMAINLRALYQNLQANSWGDTEVLPIGASDHIGIETLFGASSTGASLIDNWAGAASAFKRTIPVSTLDAMLGSRFPDRRLVIKVDVEGHEYLMLRGASDVLDRKVKPIWLVEITLGEYHPEGPNPRFADTFELFRQRGYLSFLVGDGALKEIGLSDARAWQSAGRTATAAINYLFVPADALEFVEGL